MLVEPTVFDGPEAVGRALAALIADRIEAAGPGRTFLLGCPSGRSPWTTYVALAREVADRRLDLTGLVIVMMDEYVERDGGTGEMRLIDSTAPHSCLRFGQTEIVDRLNAAARPGPLNGLQPDLDSARRPTCNAWTWPGSFSSTTRAWTARRRASRWSTHDRTG